MNSSPLSSGLEQLAQNPVSYTIDSLTEGVKETWEVSLVGFGAWALISGGSDLSPVLKGIGVVAGVAGYLANQDDKQRALRNIYCGVFGASYALSEVTPGPEVLNYIEAGVVTTAGLLAIDADSK